MYQRRHCMTKIITISREFGAGGGEIGKRLAEKLGWEFYDKALILEAAKEAGISGAESVIEDEIAPTNFGFGQSLFDFYNRPLNEKLFAAQKEVIRKIAEHGKCVIVGRNANAILKEFDNAIHVFITADSFWRAERLQSEKMTNMPMQKVQAQVIAVDKKRKKYCSYYTDTEFGEAKYYDICLDSSKIGIDKCIDVIYSLVKQ